MTEHNGVELARAALAGFTPGRLAAEEQNHAAAVATLDTYVRLARDYCQGSNSRAVAAALAAHMMSHAGWSTEYARGVAALAVVELAATGWRP